MWFTPRLSNNFETRSSNSFNSVSPCSQKHNLLRGSRNSNQLRNHQVLSIISQRTKQIAQVNEHTAFKQSQKVTISKVVIPLDKSKPNIATAF